ncbi:hypothetical protein FQZ97_946400 [compost metagenome]
MKHFPPYSPPYPRFPWTKLWTNCRATAASRASPGFPPLVYFLIYFNNLPFFRTEAVQRKVHKLWKRAWSPCFIGDTGDCSFFDQQQSLKRLSPDNVDKSVEKLLTTLYSKILVVPGLQPDS